MDELLQHCLQELAFDGDLGCNVSRLRDFVFEFYSSRNAMHQAVDDAYYAFVWSLIARHPSVRIGVLPDGQTADVYIPPQPRVSKKGKSIQDDAQKEVLEAATLSLIPDASQQSLEELNRLYGDRLRIAVDSEICFVAVTGSHAKSPKLTPMIYAALQIIARSRDSGISVLELGRTTGYDQKACFYIVKQLLELDLIVKLRRGGNSQNFCVHKYFFDRSPTWNAVHEEELRVQDESTENIAVEDGPDIGPLQLPHFDPMDTRHLTSLNILRQRLIKLLKHSPDRIQPYTNISVKIGFYPRSRTDRRFFIVRLNELINEGVIEKIFMPSLNPDTTQNRQLFLRLSSSTRPFQHASVAAAPQISDNDEEMIDNLATDERAEQMQLKSTLTPHRQIVDFLQRSSSAGATLNELSYQLASFDKKTLELLISRMEHQAPPRHLADLAVQSVLETYGRERRYRYFTLDGYCELAKREPLERPKGPYPYSSEDVSKAGSFMEDRKSDFYESRNDIEAFYKKWSRARVHRFRISAGEPHQESRSRTGSTSVRVAFGAPRASQKKRTNPILPDGTRKRGRPRKNPDGIEKPAKRAKKTSGEGAYISLEAKERATSIDNDVSMPVAPGILKRKREESGSEFGESAGVDVQSLANRDGASQTIPKRKRGRPKKKRVDDLEVSSAGPTAVLTRETAIRDLEAMSLQAASSSNVPRSLEVPSASASESVSTSFPLIHPVPSHELQAPSTTTSQLPPNDDGQANSSPALLLDSLSRLQGDSSDRSQCQINGNFSDNVTGVLASLAAQVNASFSSCLPSVDRESVVTSCPSVYPDFSAPRVENAMTDSDQQNKRSKTENDNVTPEDKRSSEGQELSNNRSAPLVRSPSVALASGDAGSIDDDKSSVSALRKEGRRRRRQEQKANLSSLRRENELVQLIENAGGILNTSTADFLTAFMNLIKTSAKAGEATSAPIGARSDRRTLNYALDKLEADGRIRTIITTIPSVTGVYRNAKIVYLPTISEEHVRNWLLTQGFAGLVPLRQEQVARHARDENDPNSALGLAKQWLHSRDAHEVYQERWHRNPERAGQLFSQSDDVVREAMLMERQTLSQLYRYITGKIMRARALHLFTTEQLERKVDSPFIASAEERIVNWAFFENDIALATHCACITASTFMPEIKRALETEEGRRRPVKDVPDAWRQALQVGKTKSRDRIFDLLDYLHSLRLVFPLRQSTPDGPRDAATHSAFEAMPSDWASRVPLIRPEYWQFCNMAPLYLFALQNDPAPFWKTVPVGSRAEAEQYWEELKISSINKSFAEKVHQDLSASISMDGTYNGEQRVATALRRSISWVAEYTLSWYQTQYLKRFVDIRNGSTPVQDKDSGETRLESIADIIHAPLNVVRKYYVSSRETTLRELDKKRRRDAQETSEKQKADMKLVLANKKLEAIKSREAAWDAMVEKVHPGLVKGVAATRLRKLRQSYVQGNIIQDNHHWEMQISDAIKAAEKMRSSRRLFPNVSRISHEFAPEKQSSVDLSLPSTNQGKSVEVLIRMQENLAVERGVPEDGDAYKDRKKIKDRKEQQKDRTRRQRFQWNPDYDELARDAYVIVRARCRTHHRLEWAALDQIFPSVPRNSVRARVSILKDQPGADAYLQRLENCWHELWVKKRGTPELSDPNPRNPTEFDLKAHLQYLRKYVDKNAIRVGISTLEEKEYTALLADLGEFVSSWNLQERKPAQANWDFLSNFSIGEEAREKLFLDAVFVLESDNFAEERESDAVLFAEAALKMVIGTPDESYGASDAASLLHRVGEDDVSIAMDRLFSRNVFSKLVKDPTRLSPGRTVKISEMNQNALGGPIPKELFVDASQLDESYELAKEEWREWPLTSSDGDTAALLQRFSDHQIEFGLDTSHAQSTRASIEGNSRKADDDDIELRLYVKLDGSATPENWTNRTMVTEEELEPSLTEPDDMSGHGTSVLGEEGCCSLRSDGVVDCLKCVDEASSQLIGWPEKDRKVAETILQLVEEKEKSGINIEGLARVDARGDALFSIIHRLHTFRVPLLYLTGYDSSVVVSAKHAGDWAVTLPGETAPVTKIFPRRWLDITGARVTRVWESGLRAVVGLIHLRPGISQAELRWRLKVVYDRQEILELLSHLMSNGTLKIFWHGDWRLGNSICVYGLSKEDEKKVFWAVREEKRWYRIS